MDSDYVDLDEIGGTGSSSQAASQDDDSDAEPETNSSDAAKGTKDDDGSDDSTKTTTSADETAKEKPPPKEGSLASFFEKVKHQQQPNLSGQATTTKTKETPSKDDSSTKKAPDDSNKKSASEPSYKGWGQYTGKRYADLYILGLAFDKNLVEDGEARYKKVFEPIDDLVIPTRYTEIMGSVVDDEIKVTSSDDGENTKTESPTTTMDNLKERLSPNSDFVEGLDDIDKFFEGVDPPDELDVGAGGTSIQEVLMGQTTKIIIKRIVRGAQYVSTTAKAVAKRVNQYFADEDREILPNKEKLAKAGKWVTEQGRNLLDGARDLFDDLFGSDDDLGGDDFASYDDIQKKLQDLAAASEK
eukprot:Sro2582_g331870.2  (357) ;mRNA; f:6017-7087